jgi:hypothetical protein
MTKKKLQKDDSVKRIVYDAVKDQRDHWKEMYELASAENARLRERIRLLQKRDDYVTACLV